MPISVNALVVSIQSRESTRTVTGGPKQEERDMSNANKGMIDPDDAVMLLIDHQSGLFQLAPPTARSS